MGRLQRDTDLKRVMTPDLFATHRFRLQINLQIPLEKKIIKLHIPLGKKALNL